MSTALVFKMLQSFPKGTSPGPTGVRASHLVEACTLANKAVVLEQLNSVVSLLSVGQAPRELAPFLAGARLLASIKKMVSFDPLLWEKLCDDSPPNVSVTKSRRLPNDDFGLFKSVAVFDLGARS